MSAPKSKQSGFDGGRRPWNVAGDRSKGPAVKYKQPQEVIDHCLTCTMPADLCKGNCRIPQQAKPPRKSPVPEGFEKHYLSGARIEDLAAYFCVSRATITRWAKLSGLSRRNAAWKNEFWRKERRR